MAPKIIKDETIAFIREKMQKDIAEEQRLNSQETELEIVTIIHYLKQGDIGVITLGVKLSQDRYLYDSSSQIWYKWDGHNWTEDRNESIYKCLPIELNNLLEKAFLNVSEQEDNPNRSTDMDLLTAYMKKLKSVDYCNRIVNNCRRGSRFSDSEQERGLGITGEEWDINQHLMPFKNGVLDLMTGEFRNGRPTDYLNFTIPHEWKGFDEPAPNFMRYLNTSLPTNLADVGSEGDTEVIRCLQRCIAHSFGGVIKEHILVVLSGKNGRNGKTTLMEILKYALGERLVHAAQSSLLTKQTFTRSSSSPSPDLIALRGARIVYASESEKGSKMDCEQVKLLTGGDSITARPCFGQIINFPPTHQLFLLTNDIPLIAYDDIAMWYRLRIFEFPVSFVDNPTKPFERKADKNLMEKMKQEASGIIAWVIRGYMDYNKQQGINPPESVIASVRDFKMKNDTLGLFISEALTPDPNATINASKLYGAYKIWAKEAHVTPVLTQTKFGEEIKERIPRKDSSSGRVYRGYKLITN